MYGILNADSAVVESVLSFSEYFLHDADAYQLKTLITTVFFTENHLHSSLKAKVIQSLANEWSRIADGPRLLALTLHHDDQNLRAASAYLARADNHIDALNLLLADRSSIVKETAWEQLLEFEAGEFDVDTDALIQLLIESESSLKLKHIGCRVARHHKIVEATNALKDLADNDKKPYGAETTIGYETRQALLAVWPDAASWIRSTLPYSDEV